jgi:hypothetical protein
LIAKIVVARFHDMSWTWDHWHGTVEVTNLKEVATVGDANQTVALGEPCPDCRALVVDLDAHGRWHSRLVADIAIAVENEIRRTSAASR